MSAAVIGAIGNAINARSDRKAAERMGRHELEQLQRRIELDDRNRAERIQWDSTSLAEQIARERQNLQQAKDDQDLNIVRAMATLKENLEAKQASSDRVYGLAGQERGRQQEYGRAQGDAFANSLGEFGAFQPDMAAKQDSLAAIFADMLGREGPASNAPAATGETARFEADARAQASGMVGDQANKLAALQAFGGTMFDKSMAMGRNQQLNEIIRNFAQGSQAALAPEVDAASMYFQSNPILTNTPTASLPSRGRYIEQRFVNQPMMQRSPSMLGDLFVGMANAGMAYANQPTPAPSPYALKPPTTSGQTGLTLGGGGLGIRTDRPAGLGIR